MQDFESKSAQKKIKLITKELEAINRLTNIVISEVATVVYQNVSKNTNIDYYEEIKRFEIELLKYALFRAKGNQREAAQLLNMNPTTLNAKLKKFNMMEKPVDKE